MIAPVLLIAYAVVLGILGARQLQRARWPQRSPSLGIWAWQALSASVLSATLLAGATLAVPSLPVGAQLATLVDACWLAVRDQYATPGGAVVASLGLLALLTVVGRLGFVALVEGVRTARGRRAQRRKLLLVAKRDSATEVLVVPHATPAVYCLPGRRGLVVCTSAALAVLDAQQRRAVLAHERAHLRRRHAVVLTAAAILEASFPFVPIFVVARVELGRLVEMQADDAAVAGEDRRLLATALVRLADGAAPVAAIGAGGTTAFERVRRLCGPADRLNPAWSSLAVVAGATALMLPLVIAVGPGIVAAVLDYCPLGFPPSMS